MPKPWPDNLRRKSNLNPNTAAEIRDDIETVNPRWRERTLGNDDLNEQWDNNCTRCAFTVEMRARGFDMTAMPKPASVKDNTHSGIVERWVDDEGNHRTWSYIPKDQTLTDFRSRLKQGLLAQGPNARGFIIVEWKPDAGAAPGERGGGHIFNYEVSSDGTKIRFIDGQSNEFNLGVDWTREIALDSPWNGYVRTDDLRPTERVGDWTRQRTDLEVNAPTLTETNQEMFRRWPTELGPAGTQRRSAFKEGWQGIRTGWPDPRPPDYLEGFPDLIDAFEQGVAWARRPD